MHIELRIAILLALTCILVFLVFLLRRQKLELKYCLLWLVALFGVGAFCIFPDLLIKLSAFLGIATPVNTLFLICIAFLACICISLTIVVSKLSSRLRELTQNMAIIEFEREREGDE